MSTTNPIGLVVDNKYKVERLLGKGGMGAVYLATHIGTDRPVALKVIVPQFMGRDDFVERFRREAKAAGGMRHPNVVDVTDFGFATVGDQNVAYLVMEYLDGCSLGDILAEESRLPTPWIVDIVEQVCAAIDAAHKRGIVHRDLKPDNIWLEPNRRGGYTVKVLDFGLAKLTVPGIRTGAPTLEISAKPQSSSDPMATSVTGGTLAGAGHTVAHPARLTVADQPAPVTEGETQILEAAEVPAGRGTQAGQDSATMIVEAGTPIESGRTEDPATMILSAPEITMVQEVAGQANGTSIDAATQILRDETTDALQVLATGQGGGLTRVGSVIGTPTYMSPEQCRGEDLDVRSDIYSIGVITYQMLTGRPPFIGDIMDVINQHLTATPPPLKQFRKKIPRPMAKTVMSALNKDPALRPQSAAAFASAIKASLDTTGPLFRHGTAVYSELFPKLFKVSLVAHLPVIVASLGSVLIESLRYHTAFKTGGVNVTISTASSDSLLTFLASVFVVGVTVRLVTQTYVAPLRPVNLRPALMAVKRRAWSLLWAHFLVLVGSIIGLCLCVIPGALFYIAASLTTPVIMMENLKGRRAVGRSMRLVKRAPLTVVAIVIIQYSIPMLAGILGVAAVGGYLKGSSRQAAELTGAIVQFGARILNIVIVPFIATLTALLYLKVRMAGGEILDEMLSQFATEEVPKAKWQMRMRSSMTSGSS